MPAATFADWTQARSVFSPGTNWGSAPLPFQGWRRFKEAFAPELVARAIAESPVPVTHCIDPFGGSGTTALACQFLGVDSTSIEVNPYLADLIAAKLTRYHDDELVADLGRTLRWSQRSPQHALPPDAPATLIEPGKRGRWVFGADAAKEIAAIQSAINRLRTPEHRRLFRVLLGGILVDVSNVTISGKGRRYRRGWQSRTVSREDVSRAFARAAATALDEIRLYGHRAEDGYSLLVGDARELCGTVEGFQLAVFSPPYPNSFDYTDVYNLELWMLGYLSRSSDNHALRRRTLSSHVQIHREYDSAPRSSPTLERTLQRLNESTSQLWNRWIPSMVGAYFADMEIVLRNLARGLESGGTIWMVVGDSRYSEVQIRTADITIEVADALGYRLGKREPFRSMRASPQQGGDARLHETLLVFLRK